jgi:hypothetical protein
VCKRKKRVRVEREKGKKKREGEKWGRKRVCKKEECE